jgi:hypothetical protein
MNPMTTLFALFSNKRLYRTYRKRFVREIFKTKGKSAFATKWGAFATKWGAFATKWGAFATKWGAFATKWGAFCHQVGRFCHQVGRFFATKWGAFATKWGAFLPPSGALLPPSRALLAPSGALLPPSRALLTPSGALLHQVGRFEILTVTVSATSTTFHNLHFYVFVEGLVVSRPFFAWDQSKVTQRAVFIQVFPSGCLTCDGGYVRLPVIKLVLGLLSSLFWLFLHFFKSLFDSSIAQVAFI